MFRLARPGKSSLRRRCALLAGLMLFCVTALRAERLQLLGVEGELHDSVLAAIVLAAEPCDAPRWRVQRRLRDLDREAETVLRAFGYYQPTIRKALQWDKDCWRATIAIDPGEPVRVTTLDLRIDGAGRQDPEFQKLRAEPGIEVGQVLRHDRYEALKQRLLDLASERGYFHGRLLVHRLEVDPSRHTAVIRLHFDSGPRFRVSKIVLSGNRIDDAVVRRLLKIRPGDFYSTQAVLESYRALSDSGYFEQVDIEPDLERLGKDSVPLTVSLKPRKRHAWQFGLGVSSDIGVTGSVRYQNRRINRFGHRLSAEVSLSPVRSHGAVEYRIPLLGSHWRSFDAQGGWRQEETEGVRSDTFTAALRLAGKRGGWDETPFIELQRESSVVEGEPVDSTLLMPGISWERRRIDDLLRPRSGRHLRIELRGALGGALSDASFVQATASAAFLQPLGSGVGKARLHLGTTQSSDFGRLPASLRFFAGGDRSVRGYAYRSLSPRDAEGDLTGGAHLIAGSLEYEHPILKDWGAALFADAGNAFDSMDDGIKVGVGAGARWYSSVGPVRMDIGFPLDQSRDRFRLHFSFGAGL
ncbi:MAG: outer membrane protein assembly factor [Gammaproteobacteria bacterium]|nr:MAG: outer membrane protein assembly factor [Gammaproteobacteria bacterium]